MKRQSLRNYSVGSLIERPYEHGNTNSNILLNFEHMPLRQSKTLATIEER